MGQTARPLDEVASGRFEFVELPERGAAFRGSSLATLCRHLQISVEVVRKNCTKHVELVAAEAPDGQIVHLALGFKFAEHALLSAASIVIDQNLGWLARRPR